MASRHCCSSLVRTPFRQWASFSRAVYRSADVDFGLLDGYNQTRVKIFIAAFGNRSLLREADASARCASLNQMAGSREHCGAKHRSLQCFSAGAEGEGANAC